MTPPSIAGAHGAALSTSAENLSARIHAALKQGFGLRRLREGQEAVIARVLKGQSTLAIMPTGAGKSLCYQLPALLLEGRTIVVSPLIALMKDQCEALHERGVAAVQINSSLDAETVRDAERAIADGSARIVLTTPERISDAQFLDSLSKAPTSLLVVDEAHCISQWGHDFRPAFLEIAPAIAALGKPCVLALTATATETVTADIIAELGIPKAGVFNTGAYRANLHFRVEQVSREADKMERMLSRVKASPGSGIVYTATVKAAEAVYAALAGAAESVRLYHGKLGAAERHAAQEAFMDGQARVMVATNAFGLGIDKPDIRFVLHYQMPASLDAYYQESGRAGRDGFVAHCTLLFLRSDKSVQQFFMGGRYPGADDVQALYRALQQAPPEPDGWTLAALQARLKLPMNKLKVACSLLRRQRIAAVRPAGQWHLLQRELDEAALQSLMQAYEDKRGQDRAALEGMVFYAQTGQCRWKVLLAHLQEQADFAHCGHCDNCRRIEAFEFELQERARRAAQSGQGQRDADVADAAPAQASQRPLAMTFKPDEVVRVRRYGLGKVVATDALSVTVKFPAGQQRVFQADYVQRVAPRRSAAASGATSSSPPSESPSGTP